MKITQQAAHLLLTLVGGLIGGFLSTRLTSPEPVKAQGAPAVIEAREFRLVDQDGNSMGAFSHTQGVTAIKIWNSQGTQASLGIFQGLSALRLATADSKVTAELIAESRVGTSTGVYKSQLALKNEPAGLNTDLTSFLIHMDGIPGNDGTVSLSFTNGTDVSPSLGEVPNIKATIGLGKDGSPQLVFRDGFMRDRVILGKTFLKSRGTGLVTLRPVASLVLLNEDGTVAWSVP